MVTIKLGSSDGPENLKEDILVAIQKKINNSITLGRMGLRGFLSFF